MSFAFKLSFRSVLYRFRQYAALLLICCLGSGISLSMIFISCGMLKSLSGKAKVYYGGDLVLMRFGAGEKEQSIPDSSKYVELLESVLPVDSVVSKRFDFNAKKDAAIYYEGNETKINVIKGIDFKSEAGLLDSFTFIEGNCSVGKNENGVIVSQQVKKLLGFSAGDSITLLLRTQSGQINTVQLSVKGVFCDSSVFGMYTVYMDRDQLLEAFGANDDWCNRICVQLPENIHTDRVLLEKWNKALSEKVNVFPVYDDKRDFYKGIPFINETFALVPLKANLNDMSILEKAMKLIIFFIVIVMVLVIVSGIGSTFKVLVMKRINEIGIFMALGMKKLHIILMMVFEAFILLCGGFFSGVALSALFCALASQVNLSFIPAMDIFLEAGTLSPALSLKMTLILLLTIIISTLLVVFRAVRCSVSILPVNALNATK